MSAEKKYTERDLVLAKREAFVAGATVEPLGFLLAPGRPEAVAEARYPIPTVTRPRIVADKDGGEWCVIEGHFRYRQQNGTSWQNWMDFRHYGPSAPLPHRVALWADLLANPTEEVEA